MSQAPKFITLEGGEGVGKSTILKLIQAELDQQHISYVVTREPGGTAIAEEIRKILLTPQAELMNPLTEVLLMFAARVQNIEHIIKPALAAGKWVICDRFTDASLAYQGGGRQLGIERIQALAEWTLGCFKPDRTILLDAPIEVGLARIQRRTQRDRIEQEQAEFFQRVRETYLYLAKQDPQRYRVIAADQKLADVEKDVLAVIQELM